MGYLRVLLIMLLSFIVVIIGTVVITGAERGLARSNGLWLSVFVMLVAVTVTAARLSRRR